MKIKAEWWLTNEEYKQRNKETERETMWQAVRISTTVVLAYTEEIKMKTFKLDIAQKIRHEWLTIKEATDWMHRNISIIMGCSYTFIRLYLQNRETSDYDGYANLNLRIGNK